MLEKERVSAPSVRMTHELVFAQGGTRSWGAQLTKNPKHRTKTLYFPRERSRSGEPIRVTLRFDSDHDCPKPLDGLAAYLQSLSSRELRLAIGDPYIEDLQQMARKQRAELGQVCLELYRKRNGMLGPASRRPKHGRQASLGLVKPDNRGQLMLPITGETRVARGAELGVTFRESKDQHVHGWYPYVEGFSASYVSEVLRRLGSPRCNVYDPFGGAGTTMLAASHLGISSFYSEINPLMCFVAETKVNAANWARQHVRETRSALGSFLKNLSTEVLQDCGATLSLDGYVSAFGNRFYFEEKPLRHLLAAKSLALQATQGRPELENLALLAVVSNVVRASNMTRRADLRRRRHDEYKNRVVDVAAFVRESTLRILDDIPQIPLHAEPMELVSPDSRDIPAEYLDTFDLALTSPPYLNGTNYFRNTKLELWFLDLLISEKELSNWHSKGVAGGINSVRKSDAMVETQFEEVERIAKKLDARASDNRIALMVRRYFADMADVLRAVYSSLRAGGTFVLDLGDSRFHGVHVPTHSLLEQVAKQVGYEAVSNRTIARRHSRDKSPLVQVELIFRKPASKTRTGSRNNRSLSSSNDLRTAIHKFQECQPYKAAPYSSRAWGHPLHSLCSFQGKLKPSIAHWLVKTFAPPGATILDPLGGVGTVALEAGFLGHRAVSSDKSPLPALVATAKLDPPSKTDATEALRSISNRIRRTKLSASDADAANFGLNAAVADYYQPRTLEEVLKARKVFIRDGSNNQGEALVWSCLLHILHGNRPYALSRTSHPLTPFNPSGPFEYKSLLKKLDERVHRLLRHPLPPAFERGTSLLADFRDLELQLARKHFDLVITSPPFLGMRFDRPNWLRLWFLGWGQDDFHHTSQGFLERQQVRSGYCYVEFFVSMNALLRERGLMIIHIGSGGTRDLAEELVAFSQETFELVGRVHENVEQIEKHGVRDKGRTTTHNFLFFLAR